MNEYESLRNEVIARIKILHHQISLAVTLSFLFIFGFIIFYTNHEALIIYLLALPVVFYLLAFNSQANQMTMEAAAYHIMKKHTSNWDKFYGEYKKGVRITSFLKVLPFFFTPIFCLIYLPIVASLSKTENIFYIIDWVLLALVIYNFRYKFKR